MTHHSFFLFFICSALMPLANAAGDGGECGIINAFYCAYNGAKEWQFFVWHNGGAQHALLDQFYLDYFTELGEEKRKNLFLKIASYTHVYLLRWKLERHRHILMSLLLNTNGILSTSLYKYTKDVLKTIHCKYIWKNDYKKALCILLSIKKHLTLILDTNRSAKRVVDYEAIIVDEQCLQVETVHEIIQQNYEQINEWMLSDMVHFLGQKQRLTKYFHTMLSSDDPAKITATSHTFMELFGVARFAIICYTHEQKLGKICDASVPNYFYELAYIEYFLNETVLGKWRIKMVIEFNLYNVWMQKMFDEQFSEFEKKVEATIAAGDINKTGADGTQQQQDLEVAGMKIAFLSIMLEFWSNYNKIFWHSEKRIRQRMDKILNTCKHKHLNLVEMAILMEKDENRTKELMLLWEDGPEDISLYRALSICIKNAISEYNQRSVYATKNHSRMMDMDESIMAKLVICLGKKIKNNNGPSKTAFLSQLHYDILLEICKQNDELKRIIIENNKQLKDFLSPSLHKKLLQELDENDEYISGPEDFDGSEPENEFYTDAVEEFDDEQNKNCQKIVGNENEPKLKMADEEIGGEIVQKNSVGEENLKNNKNDLKDNEKEKEMNKCLSHGINELMNGNVTEINEELIALNSENEFWIKQSQYKKAKSKGKNETKAKNKFKKKNWTLEKSANLINKKCTDCAAGDEKVHELVENSNCMENEMMLYQKDFKYCKKTFKEIGFNKIGDLLNDSVLLNGVQFIMHKKLDEKSMECVKYLNNVALLLRAIHAKVNFVGMDLANRTIFTSNNIMKKWNDFMFNDHDQHLLDSPQFLQDKLYFLHAHLDEYEFDNLTILLESFIKIIDENQITKIKIKEKFLPISLTTQTATQFGTYAMHEFNKILSALELHECAMLIAKGVINFEIIGTLENLNANTEDEKVTNRKCLCINADIERRYIQMLENMLQQKTLDSSLPNHFADDPELSQYKLIRTNMKNCENDIQISNEISNFISPKIGLDKKKEIKNLKQNIKETVSIWAAQFSTIQPLIIMSGSLLMNGYIDGSDMDLLCVLSDKIKFEQIYDEKQNSLYNFLKNNLHDVATINWIPGKVKILRIEHQYIEVDLLPVLVPEAYLLEKDVQIENDQLIQQMTDETGIFPLAGYRSSKFQLSLIPNQKKFAALLKALKIWAKNRLIYSGIYGYFNGATLSVMATKICIFYPDAPLSYLLHQFFATYSKWNWSSRVPVILERLTPIALNPIVRRWPPLFGISSMTVLTPKFPEQNSAFNVNSYTIQTLIDELKIANQILSQNIKNWDNIFEEKKIKKHFQYFAVILCTDTSQLDDSMPFCALQRSKIRETLLAWASQKSVTEKIDNYHIIPQSEQRFICKQHNDHTFGRLWLVGLKLKNGNNGDSLNLVPIYQNDDSTADHKTTTQQQQSMKSFFTETENLDRIINNLRHVSVDERKFS